MTKDKDSLSLLSEMCIFKSYRECRFLKIHFRYAAVNAVYTTYVKTGFGIKKPTMVDMP